MTVFWLSWKFAKYELRLFVLWAMKCLMRNIQNKKRAVLWSIREE